MKLWCLILDSIDPLTFDQDNGIDDAIISVFAVQTVFNDPSGDVDLEKLYTQR